jgi:uncharacterized protein
MNRFIDIQLDQWTTSARRKPLVLQGARQVGKTYALKSLAKRQYQTEVYCNFEEDRRLHALFTHLDPMVIVGNLEAYYKIKINPESTLIIFDEIQECPDALLSLKYFNEKAPSYHVATAGSLLGVKLGQQKSFPVGQVNFLQLYPLNFLEFLAALGYHDLATMISTKVELSPLNAAIHNKLMELLRRYILVGGMPEAVVEYSLDINKFLTVREVQMEILKSYEYDFVKHTTATEAQKLALVWGLIPSQLAKENRKFIFSAIKKSARGREFYGTLKWLYDAGMTYQASPVTKPGLPLTSYAEAEVFKVYLMDTGLLAAMSRLDPSAWTIGDQLFTEFKGALTENYVAQQLVSKQQSPALHYWRSENTAEIDFVVAAKQSVIPVEVKSGQSLHAKSKKVYIDRYAPTQFCVLSGLNFSSGGNILNIPLYAVSELANYLAQ